MKMIGYESLLVGWAKGWHDGSSAVTFSFLTQAPDYYPRVDKSGNGKDDTIKITRFDPLPIDADVEMTAAEQALARLAIAAWNDVAKLNLVAADPDQVGDVTFGSAEFRDKGTFGFIPKFPDSLGDPNKGGDVWINSSNGAQDKSIFGHTSWQTYLHETGHALGLHHPNEDPDNDRRSLDNSNQYTVMSYVEHPGETDLGFNKQGWPITAMLYDIAAIQELYGANTDTRAGDTSYFGDARGSELAYQYGAAGMKVLGRDVILTLWDAGGHDVIDGSDFRTGVKIDLNPGAFSTLGEIENNVAIAYAVEVDGVVINYIEDAVGTNRQDTLIGNDTDNVLKGRGGADALRGGAGADKLVGGRGADAFVFDGTLDEGADRIKDFRNGKDFLRVSGIDFSEIEISGHARGSVIALGAGTEILLVGVDSSLITQLDFEFV
jgi:serralysin